MKKGTPGMCFFHTFRGRFLAKTRKFISRQEAISREWYAGDTLFPAIPRMAACPVGDGVLDVPP